MISAMMAIKSGRMIIMIIMIIIMSKLNTKLFKVKVFKLFRNVNIVLYKIESFQSFSVNHSKIFNYDIYLNRFYIQ